MNKKSLKLETTTYSLTFWVAWTSWTPKLFSMANLNFWIGSLPFPPHFQSPRFILGGTFGFGFNLSVRNSRVAMNLVPNQSFKTLELPIFILYLDPDFGIICLCFFVVFPKNVPGGQICKPFPGTLFWALYSVSKELFDRRFFVGFK